MTNGNVFTFKPDWQGKGLAVASVQLPLVGTELVIPDSHEGKPVREIKCLFPDEHPEGKKLQRVVIPDSIVRLDYSAFDGCENLTEVRFSNESKLGFIGDHAFNKCKKLKDINVPATLSGIGDFAFYGCESLESFRFGEPLILLGENAFEDCTGLKEITFDMYCNLLNIKEDTFSGCENLEEISLSLDITNIGKRAFAYCSSLRFIYIPDDLELETIGEEAFVGCSALEDFSFMDCPKLSSIGNYAFYNSTKMKTAHFRKNAQVKLGENVFPKGVKTVNLKSQGCYVATCVYGSYDCAPVWTLRRFRDEKLAKSVLGRAFIRLYYAVSPTAVRWFGKTKWFNGIFRPLLDKFVNRLNDAGYEDTPYND